MTLEELRPALMRLGFYRDSERRGERWFSPRHLRQGQVIVWLYKRTNTVVWCWTNDRGDRVMGELKTQDDVERFQKRFQRR